MQDLRLRPHLPGNRAVLSALAIATVCVGLGGCDILYGIRRSTIVAPTFAAECIRATVTATPDVTSLKAYRSTDPKMASDPLIANQFIYQGSRPEVGALIRLEYARDGGVRFNHEHLMLNHRPAQADLDDSRALMRLVEQRIADACGLPELRTSMVEK